ncbi:MAG: tRNA dihydrouridine(20/20a) synthase DusA [Hyphomicrobiales bacterium]|nr:MAG: tRNA dihydrouridine(20/20a) synthase DusA [Hyphomicrobiales bacterium]
MTSQLRNFGQRISVAPMMDWTDRACRSFHRKLSTKALLYTEMVVADAVIHGHRDRLLAYPEHQHPVALQLGGSDPAKLAEATRVALGYGYDEINLNVGCPSDRVQSGTFGACLMQTPDLVARCVAAMKEAAAPDKKVLITVKCRLGVDDQNIETALDELADGCIDAGVDALWVHARKAWLKGLSPKENRDIPPLDYDRVYRLKARLKNMFVGINGGIANLDEAEQHLAYVDGVMIGRAAYHDCALLLDVDQRFYGSDAPLKTRHQVLREMYDEIENHLLQGGKMNHYTRHIIGLFHGQPGARTYRQILSTKAVQPGAGVGVIEEALAAMAAATDQLNRAEELA